MGKVRGRIKIELMSDLCAGSGYSYAGIIDSDAFYDEYGFPWIPARRLKGCMREAAELVCPEAVEALFGKTGDTGTKGIILGNAYMEGHREIEEELKAIREQKREEAFYLSPQNVLNMYTCIRAQTRINQDTGVAEENTLRYTRVVGQYDPLKDRSPLCFYAEVEFDQADQQNIERIMKAVRNLGMNRNRGLGSVRCRLDVDSAEPEKKENVLETPGSGENLVCLTYVLCNQEPLLMSSDNTGESDSYISGKSILGTLAGSYLRMTGADPESEEFRQMFLDGTTVFTDANLTFPPLEDGEEASQWPAYYPAPLYLNRLKKTKALVNLLADHREIPKGREADYNVAGGNLPRKLKTHYVCEAKPNTYRIAEAEREIYYHNSQREQLYSQEALKEGQYFRGKIYTLRRYAGLLKMLLEESRLSFGKSKTAQYGTCTLAARVTMEDAAQKETAVKEGERVALVLSSDAIFLNENGYTVRFEEVKELAAAQLEIPYVTTKDEGSMIQTREVTGYNSTWNLKRPGIPAVKAGSVLVYTIASGKCWRKTFREDVFIGERNLEGYGQARVLECRDMVYASGSEEAVRHRAPGKSGLIKTKPFLMKILTEQTLERLIFLYTKKRTKLNLTAATVGRLDLMLKESLNEYRQDPGQALKDFCSRIESIKRKREREEAFRLLRWTILSDDEGRYELDLQELSAAKMDSVLDRLQKLLKRCVTAEEYKNMLAGIWGIYMENILTYHKYIKKQEGGRDHEE